MVTLGVAGVLCALSARSRAGCLAEDWVAASGIARCLWPAADWAHSPCASSLRSDGLGRCHEWVPHSHPLGLDPASSGERIDELFGRWGEVQALLGQVAP